MKPTVLYNCRELALPTCFGPPDNPKWLMDCPVLGPPGEEVEHRPHGWLTAYIPRVNKRRREPAALRVWTAALLHLPIEHRNGDTFQMAVPRKTIKRWINPDGKGRKGAQGQAVVDAALDGLSGVLTGIPLKGMGVRSTRLVKCVSAGAEAVQLAIRCPATHSFGQKVEWERVMRYGVQSALWFRLYLALTARFNDYGRKGRPMSLTVRRSGRVRRNPAAIRCPIQTEEELAWQVGNDGASKQRRHEIRGALKALEADGAVVLEGAGRGRWRVFRGVHLQRTLGSPTADPRKSVNPSV